MLMLRRTHKLETDRLKLDISDLKVENIRYRKGIASLTARNTELDEALTMARQEIGRLQELALELTADVAERDEKLSKAIELTDRERDIIRAKRDGFYIYDVTDGEKLDKVAVPVKSKHHCTTAKKLAGYTRETMKGVVAERWTI